MEVFKVVLLNGMTESIINRFVNRLYMGIRINIYRHPYYHGKYFNADKGIVFQ